MFRFVVCVLFCFVLFACQSIKPVIKGSVEIDLMPVPSAPTQPVTLKIMEVRYGCSN